MFLIIAKVFLLICAIVLAGAGGVGAEQGKAEFLNLVLVGFGVSTVFGLLAVFL